MHGRAKPLLFSFFADGATQSAILEFDYFTEKRSSTAETPRETWFRVAFMTGRRWPCGSGRRREGPASAFLCDLGVSAVEALLDADLICTTPDANRKT